MSYFFGGAVFFSERTGGSLSITERAKVTTEEDRVEAGPTKASDIRHLKKTGYFLGGPVFFSERTGGSLSERTDIGELKKTAYFFGGAVFFLYRVFSSSTPKAKAMAK